ncbi:hypothetical protein [Hungatella sp.]|uniref:hypothetical protein n=1 Tax=Hungatella sp. TaxID=2613924 RepID=UPI002A82771E|nr:hypothetical protein [Hungatella sp.]
MKLKKGVGAIPYHTNSKGDLSIMRVMTIMKAMNTREVPYTLPDGKTGTTCRMIASQNDDSEIGEERISPELFSIIEKGGIYEFRGNKRKMRNGEERTVWDKAKLLTNNDKALMD